MLGLTKHIIYLSLLIKVIICFPSFSRFSFSSLSAAQNVKNNNYGNAQDDCHACHICPVSSDVAAHCLFVCMPALRNDSMYAKERVDSRMACFGESIEGSVRHSTG